MKKTLIILVGVGIVGAGAWLVQDSAFMRTVQGKIPFLAAAPASLQEPFVVPPLTDTYRNEQFGFSLALPEGFNVGELPPDERGAHTILLQNDRGEGIQIYITPQKTDTRVLSEGTVRASIPDMRITDVQPVEIGDDYRGVAFKSDNEAFGGASREVWFYFHGNLYQISTYERLDNLMQTMFGTWQFF